MLGRAAVAWAAALSTGALGALWLFEGTARLGQTRLMEESVHVVLIGLAVVVTGLLATLSLRTFYVSGDSRALVLGVGLGAFAAIYVWHGAFTRQEPAFAFLVYGPVSRMALGISLPFLALSRVVRQDMRFVAVAATGVGLAVLALAGYLMHPAIAAAAEDATRSELQRTRLLIEVVAGLLALTSAIALASRSQARTGDPLTLMALTLLAVQSVYFLATGAWTIAWWGAHALGAASSLVLTFAIVGALRTAEQKAELHKLRELDRHKTTFLNAAAHQISTPLTPIKIHLTLLQRPGQRLSAKQRAALSTISRNIDRLEDLSERILEGARSGAAEALLRPEDVDLAETLEALHATYRPWCEEKDISLHIQAPAALSVRTDRASLDHILGNLMSNAIKHTHPGGTIQVRTRLDRRSVEIDVTDDGEGIAPRDLGRLFQPFGMVDPRRESAGSGLGLYLAAGHARRLGGSLRAHSDGLGRGSRFTLELPLGRT